MLPVFSSFIRTVFHNNSGFDLVGPLPKTRCSVSRNVGEKTIDGNFEWGKPWPQTSGFFRIPLLFLMICNPYPDADRNPFDKTCMENYQQVLCSPSGCPDFPGRLCQERVWDGMGMYGMQAKRGLNLESHFSSLFQKYFLATPGCG